MSKKQKYAYKQYRQKVFAQGIFSYIDFNGNTFTACEECLNADCKSRINGSGCLNGELPESVLSKIAREVK